MFSASNTPGTDLDNRSEHADPSRRTTVGIVAIFLKDAAQLEEDQAAWLNKKNKSKHADPQPLFTADDADHAIALLRPIASLADVEVCPGLVAHLTPAGHILGASSVQLRGDGARVVCSTALADIVTRTVKRMTAAARALECEM